MNNNYVFYINNNSDYAFNDIGIELFKLAIAMAYSFTNNKFFAITDINYLKVIQTFINMNFNLLDLSKLNYNYNCITLNKSNYNQKEIINTNTSNCIIKIEFSFEMINDNIRELLSMCIIQNPKYTTSIHSTINDIMNFFKDYEINNYVCIYMNKTKFIKNYYEKSYYNNFSNCKMIVLTDDINWSIKNLDFINNNKYYLINNDYNNRFINFALFGCFNNFILDKDNMTGLWAAFVGNKNKKVIVPNDISDSFILNNWLKQ